MGIDHLVRPRPAGVRSGRLPARYLALLGIGTAAVVLVGGSAYAAVASIRSGHAALVEVDAISIRHQDADTHVHGVYAHALTAVDHGVTDDLLGEIRAHSARVHDDLAANRQAAGAALPAGSALAVAQDRLARQADSFCVDALRLVQVARTRPATARADLGRLRAVFESIDQDFDATWDDLSQEVGSVRTEATRRLRLATVTIVAAAGCATGLMMLLGALVLSADRRAAREAQRETELHQFTADLHAAFEMIDTEPDACVVSAEALSLCGCRSGRASELKLADSSRSAISTVAATPAAPNCDIQAPWDCVAVRRGQRMVYPSGDALRACRKLRGRPGGPVSAVCIPVAFMGRTLGVLHSTAAAGAVPDHVEIEQLATIADQTGHRIGTIRAFSQSELRASTDGLTGLLNRRTVEERIREAIAAAPGVPFTVVMADLDHFKNLNDIYGHDAGDQALRQFAAVLRQALRSQDIVGRYGGEEFLIFFPDASPADAAGILERMQADLATACAVGAAAPVTVSLGAAGNTERSGLSEVLTLADTRLRRAKQLGRNRIVVTDDERPPGSGSPPPDREPSAQPVRERARERRDTAAPALR
jgi:diguanylate cyclase (GGDEF)-like protein